MPARPPSSIPEPLRAELERRKRASVAQLLFKVARLVNERAMTRIEAEHGMPLMKAAYASLLPHLDFEGVRVVDLARKLGISKQAVSQTLAELVERGVVEFVPDPEDGRAKRARLTKAGAEAIGHGLSVLRQVEAELAEVIGTSSLATLHGTLLRLETALTDDGSEG